MHGARPRRLGARLVLVVGALGVVLLAVEVAFRVLGTGPVTHRPFWNEALIPAGSSREMAPYGFIPHAVVRSHYDSDPRGYIGPSLQLDHVHNSVGWRDREHELAPQPSTVRILGLGDSFLWGQGVRLEDTMLSRLATSIDVPGYRVETINAGLLGTNTVFQLGSLRHRGLAYAPDLVLLVFVPNDVEVMGGGSSTGRLELLGYSNRELDPDRERIGLRSFEWARQVIERRLRSRRYVRQSMEALGEGRPGWTECRQALIEMGELCRSREIPFVVALFPFLIDLDGGYPFRPVHEKVVEVCVEHGIRYVDLWPAFSRYQGPELWVHPTDQHPNEIGHAIAAAELAPILQTLLMDRVDTSSPSP